MPPYASSTQIDSLLSIDMKSLRAWGVLEKVVYWGRYLWSRSGEKIASISYTLNLDHPDGPCMRLNYRTIPYGETEWVPREYDVKLISTPCHYGGKRWWFCCPILGCGRRSRILYSHRTYYVCRKCTGCWYDSQNYRPPSLRALHHLFNAEDFEQNLKRKYYRGQPTRRYRRFLSKWTPERMDFLLERASGL